MRILVVEDSEDLAETLVEVLEKQKYAVDLAVTGCQADELMFVNDYDLVVLDWTIPAPPGIELLRIWRGRGSHTPVLMLTARKGVADKVAGLDSGADDYLTKPFSFAELLARVRSLLRRRGKTLQVLRAGDLELDPSSRKLTLAGEAVDLQPKEFGIVEYLLTRAGETVSRAELVEHVWDDSFDAMSNILDVLVYRVRKQIDGGGRGKLLHTVKGVGFVLEKERS